MIQSEDSAIKHSKLIQQKMVSREDCKHDDDHFHKVLETMAKLDGKTSIAVDTRNIWTVGNTDLPCGLTSAVASCRFGTDLLHRHSLRLSRQLTDTLCKVARHWYWGTRTCCDILFDIHQNESQGLEVDQSSPIPNPSTHQLQSLIAGLIANVLSKGRGSKRHNKKAQHKWLSDQDYHHVNQVMKI